jgi:hypothetical protein
MAVPAGCPGGLLGTAARVPALLPPAARGGAGLYSSRAQWGRHAVRDSSTAASGRSVDAAVAGEPAHFNAGLAGTQ